MNTEKQKTILIVEDEAIIAMSEKMTIEKYGYEVITANTGEEAVALVEKTPAIDLILMDIDLGKGMDGTEAAEIILRDRDIPIVFLSSHTEAEIVARTEKITAYGFIVKNSSTTVFQALLKMVFKLFEAKAREKKKESRDDIAFEALRESVEEFRGYFNMGAVGACVTSLDKGWIQVNDRLCRMLGYAREELLRLTWAEMTHPDDLNADLDLFNQVLAGQRDSYELEKRFIRKDGRTIHTLLYVSCQRNPDRSIHHFLASLVDISELKRATEALRQSEAHAQALLRTIPDMLFRIDRQGIFLDYKADSKDLYAQSETNLIGKNYRDILPAGPSDLIDRKSRAALETGKLQTFEYQLEMPGRGICDYEARMVASGADEVTTIVRDITERKRAEEALRISEAKQANALQMTKSGNWEYDVDSDLFTFNDNFYRIFRTTAAAVGGYQMSAAEYARRFCHPDDAPQVGEETRAAMAAADPGYSRQIEHRILYADGKIGTIAVRFFIVKDAQGRTIKTYGVNQDITERKRSEEEAKRQLAEKEILLKEVHHRIKNNIASIGGLLSMRLQSIRNPEAVAVLQDAIGRVDSMRILYEKLLLSKGYENISVKNYIESLADSIVALFPDSARIAVEKSIADIQLDPKRLFPLGLIINELLTNIMKYAFAGRDSGRIRISLSLADNRVRLVLQDDGVGLPQGFAMNQAKGFGLILVKMLSQQLGGDFSIESHEGTRSSLEFAI